jgi:nitrogen fixation protein FixH
MKKIVRLILANRWPAFLGGILMMAITANAVLVYVATRPNVPKAIENYYERSLNWDADAAVVAASRALGWTVHFAIPAGEQFAMAMRRPVDVTIRRRNGEPVTGLTGRLLCQPPGRSDQLESGLTELPHERGHYRALAPIAQPGEWQLSLDGDVDGTPFVYSERIMVAGQPSAKGPNR